MNMEEYVQALEIHVASRKLRQYRIMEQVLSPKDFAPRESVEKAGILDVFPFFHTAQLGQKIRRKPQSPPSGVALILGDSESVLSLLYESYDDINPMYDDQIKADFAELYQALNGMPLQEMDWIINPVCSLRRDHERNGFVYGVQIGIRSALEGKITK